MEQNKSQDHPVPWPGLAITVLQCVALSVRAGVSSESIEVTRFRSAFGLGQRVSKLRHCPMKELPRPSCEGFEHLSLCASLQDSRVGEAPYVHVPVHDLHAIDW